MTREPAYSDPLVSLYQGDCLEVMAELEADSVDAIVTDPPYGLEFMGREWDTFRTDPRVARWSAERSGGAGAGFQTVKRNGSEEEGHVLPRFHTRRQTSQCQTCGKRDAFRNPHACGELADWRAIAVDSVPIEAHAFQEWSRLWGVEALRIAKPGAYLLSFGGTRTYHRMAAGLEDAGWEIRDCVVWGYHSGYPKGGDISKIIDRSLGAEREVTQVRLLPDGKASRLGFRAMTGADGNSPPLAEYADTRPATPEAAPWEGWSTTLKPAWEPIVLARKPMVGSVVQNVLTYGTGAMNIDATRIPIPAGEEVRADLGFDQADGLGSVADFKRTGAGTLQFQPWDSSKGRWPPNVMLTDPIYDGDTPGVVGGGEAGGGFGTRGKDGADYDYTSYGSTLGQDGSTVGYGDAGLASRFYLIPKADRGERERGLSGRPTQKFSVGDERPSGTMHERYGSSGGPRKATSIATGAWECDACGLKYPASAEACQRCGSAERHQYAVGRPGRVNTHPTVKPIELMRHLVRLVTPPAGVVLDPFLGSGTTCLAASEEGIRSLGIEREAPYLEIAKGRLLATPLGMGLDVALVQPRPRPRKGLWNGLGGFSPYAQRATATAGEQLTAFETEEPDGSVET